MTALYCCFIFLVLPLCQQSNNPPFKIGITADSPTVAADAEVWIKVSLTNTSNQDINEGVMYKDGINLDSTFRFEVRDEHGKLVPKRTYPHEELRTGSVIFRTIRPEQTLLQEQRVSALYDMRKPGKYTLQVWRRDPKYDIKSNIVTITVTPKCKVPARKRGKVPHHRRFVNHGKTQQHNDTVAKPLFREPNRPANDTKIGEAMHEMRCMHGMFAV